MSPYRALLVGSVLLLLAFVLTLVLRPTSPSLAERLRTGSEVSLSPGTYRLEAPLELGRGLRLLGAGRERTRLVLAPGLHLQAPLGGEVLLRGLTLEREGEVREAPPLLEVPATSRLVLEDTALRGSLGMGLLLVRGEVVLRDSLLEGGPKGVAVALSLGEGGKASLEGTVLRNAIQAALVLTRGSRAEVRDGEIGPTGHNGILVYPGGRVRAEGVRFLGNPYAAVAILGEAEVVLRGNRAEGGQYALALGPGAKPLLEGNEWATRAAVARVE